MRSRRARAAAVEAAGGLETVDLASGTLIDPSGVEVATPVALEGGWYRIGFDGSGTLTSPTAFLAYAEALDVTWADRWRAQTVLEVRSASATDVLALVGLASSLTLSSAAGVWAGILEDAPGQWDYMARAWSESVIGTASVAGDPPALHGDWAFAGRLTNNSWIADKSTTPSTWRVDLPVKRDTSMPTSGTVYQVCGVGLGVAATASETVEVRLRRLVTPVE